MMFAQANSEHCRHKIFNASWVIDGEAQEQRLFGMIKSTTEKTPDGVLSAYSDNAAVIEGWHGARLMPRPDDREYEFVEEPIHILMKVETHNHPTAISPFPGAATGSRRRDSRRGCHRSRRETESGPDRLYGVASAHSGLFSSPGKTTFRTRIAWRHRSRS